METHAVYIRLHRRHGYWRVAVIFPHSIHWRCYRQADCPTPEDVLARVRVGLSTSDDSPDELDNRSGNKKSHENSRNNKPHYPNDSTNDLSWCHHLPPSNRAHDPGEPGHRPESEDQDDEQCQKVEREDPAQPVDRRGKVEEELRHGASPSPGGWGIRRAARGRGGARSGGCPVFVHTGVLLQGSRFVFQRHDARLSDRENQTTEQHLAGKNPQIQIGAFFSYTLNTNW